MQTRIKQIIIAGIPIYFALFMVAGRAATGMDLPNFIEEVVEVMWQATYPLLFIAAIIPRDTLINIGAFRCREEWDGWCSVTPLALFVFAFILSTFIYGLLVRFEHVRKKAAPKHSPKEQN